MSRLTPLAPGQRRYSQAARREAVEDAIRREGWSHSLAVRVAEATGWGWRTIYRDREEILDRLASEEQTDIPRRRVAFLADVRALREAATESRAFAPAAKLLSMEGTVLGLDRAPLPYVEAETPDTVDTSLERLLADVRRLRRRAEAGDSYVAAEKLLEREAAIIGEIRRRDEETKRADRADLTEDELVDTVIEIATTLPAPLRSRLLAALAAG